MQRNPFLRSLTLINQSGISYVVVGGFAVVMHGVNRFTPDLNVVVSFEEAPLKRLFELFTSSELLPSDSTMVDQFLAPPLREKLLPEQKKRFLSFYDHQAPSISS